MNKKRILAVCAVVASLIGASWATLSVVRWTRECALRAARDSCMAMHSRFARNGYEVGMTFLEIAVLANANELESLLAHPLEPWWHTRPRGSYDPLVALSHAPSRQARLSDAIKSRERFMRDIGITNQQGDAILFERLIEISERMRKTEDSQQSAAPLPSAPQTGPSEGAR